MNRYRVFDKQAYTAKHLRRPSTTTNPRYAIVDETGKEYDAFTTKRMAMLVAKDMNDTKAAPEDIQL